MRGAIRLHDADPTLGATTIFDSSTFICFLGKKENKPSRRWPAPDIITVFYICEFLIIFIRLSREFSVYFFLICNFMEVLEFLTLFVK